MNSFMHGGYVLIADDDADDTEMLTAVLKELESGLNVIVVDNGKGVMEQLEKVPASANVPCMLVMDMNMPRMDGRETVVAIKNHEDFKNMPLLLSSSSKNKTDELFAEKWGVRYFQKPDTMQGLRELAQIIIAMCRERNEA